MLPNIQLGFIVEDFVKGVGGFPMGGRRDERAIPGILVGSPGEEGQAASKAEVTGQRSGILGANGDRKALPIG